jgi:transcriptional regulator with GAF, ATPase, and Fis domain
MSIKIKKRSKLFLESLGSMKADGDSRLTAIADSITTLAKEINKLSAGEEDNGRQYVKLKKSLVNLNRSVADFKGDLTDGMEKLTKDYGWLKNKLVLLEDERKNFKTLYELSSILDNETELENLLQSVVDSITEVVNADYGIIELISEDGKVKLSREASSNSNGLLLLEMKDKVLDAAIDSGSSVVMNSLILKDKENGDKRKFGSVMCVPLKTDDYIFGAIYFGAFRKSFTADETDLIEELEERISLAIANNIKFNMIAESSQEVLAELRSTYNFSNAIGESPQLATVLSIVADIADSNTSVLIEGESGTGKEVVARAIHYNSSRREQPFIPINCSAIPETLLESELFGYEKGAFTGAVNRKPGKFEQANGGTILLDEIGDLPLTLQVKLLRFLQSHEFEPLGSNKVVKSDIRIITATKRDLSRMVESGEFRDDLFYRINVINIHIPPLRERKCDISALTEYFISHYANKNNKEIEGISNEALSILEQYKFPGNVRELENIVERAVVLCKSKILGADDLPDHITKPSSTDTEKTPQTSYQLKLIKKKILDESVGVVEKNFIINALRKAKGNVSEAARITQMHRKQFQRLMQRWHLSAQDIVS